MIEEVSVVPLTVYDDLGQVLATRLPNGEWIQVPPSNVGKTRTYWCEKVARFVPYEVVWDGAATREGSHTKGELLGDYASIADRWRKLGVQGPGIKIASQQWWKQRLRDTEEPASQMEIAG